MGLGWLFPLCFLGVCGGVVFWVFLVFGWFFCVLSVLFCCCSATEWLLFCLGGWWGWFPGVFRVSSGVWRCFHAWKVYNLFLPPRARVFGAADAAPVPVDGEGRCLSRASSTPETPWDDFPSIVESLVPLDLDGHSSCSDVSPSVRGFLASGTRSVERGSHPSSILKGRFPSLLQIPVEPPHLVLEPLLSVPGLTAPAEVVGLVRESDKLGVHAVEL